MPRIALSTLVALVALASTSIADDVVLTKGKQVVTATIGNEGFLAYQFDVGRKKPFFLPVAAAGGFDELKKRLADPGANQDLLLKSVFVIAESAPLKANAQSRDVKDKLKFGELLVASKVEGNAVFIPEKDGWVSTKDVVPIASTVVRLISDGVPMTKIDKKDPRYYDHPHHKGIWFSIDEVKFLTDGATPSKHWAESHSIVNKSVDILTPKGETAVMKVVNHWVNEKDEPQLEETTIVRISSNRLIDYDATLKAINGAVEIGHTKEGLFAVRVPNSMREFMNEGKVLSDSGVEGTKNLWGKPAPWIDYQGKIGDAAYSVTVMDHPGNFKPSRYHVRDYGLFAVSPFGDVDYTNGEVKTPPHELKAGESVRLRYAAYPHPGDEKAAHVADVYKKFAESKPVDSKSANNTSRDYQPRYYASSQSRRSWRTYRRASR